MKNKKYKKRIYTKSERSSSAKEYLAIIGRQLKRPIEKQDRWIDKKSAILAVVYGVVMAGLAVYAMQTAEKSQEWLWLAVVFYRCSHCCESVSIPIFSFDRDTFNSLCTGSCFYACGKLYPLA